jgi:hypothetical protein
MEDLKRDRQRVSDLQGLLTVGKMLVKSRLNQSISIGTTQAIQCAEDR